jgi:hypothetical protein
MTNYRIEASKGDYDMITHCFSCGAKLKEVIIAGEVVNQCSENSLHLKVWLMNEDEAEIDSDIKFI